MQHPGAPWGPAAARPPPRPAPPAPRAELREPPGGAGPEAAGEYGAGTAGLFPGGWRGGNGGFCRGSPDVLRGRGGPCAVRVPLAARRWDAAEKLVRAVRPNGATP